jgi:hypothetical protein
MTTFPIEIHSASDPNATIWISDPLTLFIGGLRIWLRKRGPVSQAGAQQKLSTQLNVIRRWHKLAPFVRENPGQ